jgi:hypothetical protein
MKNSRENDRWLEEMFKSLPVSERIPCMRQYSEIYKEEGEKEPVSYKQTNTATYAANTWLRERVKNGTIKRPTI